MSPKRRDARVVEEARLESVYTPKAYREFESRSLRKLVRCKSNVYDVLIFFYRDSFSAMFKGTISRFIESVISVVSSQSFSMYLTESVTELQSFGNLVKRLLFSINIPSLYDGMMKEKFSFPKLEVEASKYEELSVFHPTLIDT